jgi:ABC-type antimicrobial peptide transport system permease subunit
VELTTPDKPFGPGHADYEDAPLVAATPSVFDTLGVSILRGRPFDARDVTGATPVVVISERTARNLFGSIDVVGRPCLFRSYVRPQARIEQVTVVGVAADTDTQRRGSRRLGTVYVPLAQHFESLLAFVGRTTGDPADLIEPMRSLAQHADPDLVLDHPGTATLVVTGRSVLIGLVSRLAGGLAVLALTLGMAGLFGVISHLVARRTRELGMRMALGAPPARIRTMVLRDGFEPVLSGIIMGYLVAIAVRMILRFADQFTLAEAAVFLVAPLPILAATFVACYWPARKASRVDPNVALKEL